MPKVKLSVSDDIYFEVNGVRIEREFGLYGFRVLIYWDDGLEVTSGTAPIQLTRRAILKVRRETGDE